MNVKKILSGALIGAFVFGVSASNIQPVNAASISDAKTTLDKYDKAKDKFDSARDKLKRNNSDRPDPPKDENGNPLLPPDENSDSKTTLDKAKDKARERFDRNSDSKTTLDKAKDRFGRNNSDGNNPPEPPKDENGNPLPPPDRNSEGKTTLDKAKDKYDSAKDNYDKFKNAKKIADKVK